LKIYHK